MLVDCPDCGRSYRLESSALGPRGRVLVCSRCNARWFQRSVDGERAAAQAWTTVRTTDGAGGRPAMQPLGEPAPGQGGQAFAIDARALTGGRSAFPAPWRRGFGLALAALMLAGAATAGVGARAAVVRAVPRAASLYAAIGWPVNLRGLRFVRIGARGAAATPAGCGGTSTCDVVLDGELRSVARARIVVPRLVYEVRDADGAVLARWNESPPAATLSPGQSLRFASRPQRMPPDGRTVLVRFEDAAAEDGLARQRVVSR